jgi:biotin synthase
VSVANEIRQIVERARAGKELEASEIEKLFSVPLVSEESYYIQYAAREMSWEASGGKAEIHGQIGIDNQLCPKNCQFCSFAACNRVFKKPSIATLEEILEMARDFEKNGANAILLMTTASFPFEDFIPIAREVRKHLQEDMVLIVNLPDFGYQEALALKEAGVNGIYHAVRLGEGKVTQIDPRKRLDTIKAAKQAGLKICTCLEPVGPEHTIEELVEKTLITRDIEPVFSGAGRRIRVPGSKLEKFGMVSEARMALYVAVVRLAMGYGAPLNCTHEPNVPAAIAGADILWAEAGTNPRDTEQKTEKNRGFNVQRCRQIFEEAEWEVYEGPSRYFR